MRFRPHGDLGQLELHVLSALWTRSPMSVREVLSAIDAHPPLAYTTVLTVLSRLHNKGFVRRHKRGKAHHYEPAVTREAWLGGRAAAELAALHGPPNRAVLMAFLDSAEREDPSMIEELSALIAERNRRRR